VKRILALAVAAVLLLSGCAAETATFTDDQAQGILFGQLTQASLNSLGLAAASNTIQTDSVGNYVAGVTDGDAGIEPAECANSARLLILADQDKGSDDTFYVLPNLTSGSTVIGVRARLFGSDGAAEKFMADFQAANEGCPKFTAGNDRVEVTVSEAADDSKGCRLDTVAGVDDQLLTIRTDIVREGNLAVAVQAQTNSDTDSNLLVAASAAIYAQLTGGQVK